LGKQKETLLATYKSLILQTIEYVCTILSPIVSDTNIEKLQITQNNALRIITCCTMDTNIEQLHQETKALLISCHLKYFASQLRHQAHHPSHLLYDQTLKTECPRKKKQTIFLNWKENTINVRNDNIILLTPEIQKGLQDGFIKDF